jgi:hypothetical protein
MLSFGSPNSAFFAQHALQGTRNDALATAFKKLTASERLQKPAHHPP